MVGAVSTQKQEALHFLSAKNNELRQAMAHTIGLIKTFERLFPGFENRVLEALQKIK